MIVKVQLSIRTSEAARQVLIYNEDRSVEWQGDATDDILDAMCDAPKAFFEADILDDGTISLGEETGWQAW